jgi:hypothetical protein
LQIIGLGGVGGTQGDIGSLGSSFTIGGLQIIGLGG